MNFSLVPICHFANVYYTFSYIYGKCIDYIWSGGDRLFISSQSFPGLTYNNCMNSQEY
ncbi:hypothetical protein [Nodularia chucula]|uniref:hypothetical protein n=1 Tax=Nodularia chucula TaxID=3093667 RepID=UPI0039C626E2